MPEKNRLTKNVLYCYIAIAIAFIVIRLLSTFGVFSGFGTVGTYILNASVQIGLLFVISLFLFSYLNKSKVKETFKFYGFKKMSIKVVFIAILIGVIVYVLNVYLSAFFYKILEMLGYRSSSNIGGGSYPVWLLFVNLLVTAILPAICEETAHRGMLLKGFMPLGQKKAIIISSILFGLLHLNIEQFFYATIIGFLLGYITTACENIYPAMIIHFMNNGLSVFMGFSRARNLGVDKIFSWVNLSFANNPILGALIFVLFAITMLLLLRYLIVILFKNTAYQKIGQMQDVLFKEVIRQAYLKDLDDIKNGVFEDKVQTISYEDFDKIYKNKGVDLGHFSEIDSKVLLDNQKYKMDKTTKILLISLFVLLGALTLFTFIWGVL